MIEVRNSQDRGYADHGWLKSYHTFSFASYFDKNHMSFSSLRVINEDTIAGGMGFDTHPHRDMEIITYIVDGALEHKDTLGNSAVIYPGEVQTMAAGKGIAHSEFNHLKNKDTHLLQIWIHTQEAGLTPSYGQKSFAKEIAENPLTLVISPNGEGGSIKINQDARMYIGKLKAGESLQLPVINNRRFWLQLIEGQINLQAKTISAGDGVAIVEENKLALNALSPSHFILFDLA